MKQLLHSMIAFAVIVALFSTAGCSGMNRFDTKLDMTADRLNDYGKPFYEGKLESSAKIGAMTALAFTDGESFEVADAPPELLPGDVVRVFKTEKGYEAHLWRSANVASQNDSVLNDHHGS